MTELTISVAGSGTHPVASVSGLLDMASAPDLTDAMLKILSDQPRSVIIDVSDLVAADRTSLSAFIMISHHAAAWPGCPLAVCGAGAALRTSLANVGVSRYVTMGRTRADARRRLSHAPPLLRVRERLAPAASSVQIARGHARRTCADWAVPSLSKAAESIVTELVTNSAQHAGTFIDLAFVLSDKFLYVTVRDGSAQLPAYRADDDDEGYGLRLVDAFSTHWGYSRTGTGKAIWAALRRPLSA